MKLLPHTRVEDFLAQAYRLRGDLGQLILGDVFEGIFQAQLAGWGKKTS